MRARRHRAGRASTRLGAALAGLALAAAPASAQLRGSLAEAPSGEAVPVYRVRAVEGAPLVPGVRRHIETFGSWTLICDEVKRKRVCNASQSIVGEDGDMAFSWSLAATRGGEPVFLVRAPVMAFPSRTVAMDFGGTETVIRLPSCDARLCVGFLPLDPTIAERIRTRTSVTIRYRLSEGAQPVSFTVSLDGLGAAIAGIR